jgi:hypothetical protein
MPVFPATREAEVSSSLSFRPVQAKVVKHYFKNKKHTEELGVCFKR